MDFWHFVCDMRKFVITLASALLCLTASAADDSVILSKIRKADTGVATLRADFAQRRIIAASGRVVKSAGTLWFSAPQCLHMDYSDPDGDSFTISGGKLRMRRGGNKTDFDLSSNALMSRLSETLLACIQGRAQDVAEANKADLSVTERGGAYVIAIKAREKAVRGYSDITLYYRTSDCMLIRMDLAEFGGVTNIYEMNGIRTGVTVDASIYEIR